VIYKWGPVVDGKTVLDIGCGQAIAKRAWEALGYMWFGTSMGDHPEAQRIDMHLVSGGYDLIYARHVLEHSPLPMLALLAWKRLASWTIVVVPAPSAIAHTHVGHLSLFPEKTWRAYFRFVGLVVVDFEHAQYNNPHPWPQVGSEYRFLLRRST
jgi:hypothetical protein